MRADGLRIVVAPAARLRRLGTPPGERPCDLAELARFQAGWFSRRVDPYYHPLCCRERGSWRGSTSPAPLPGWRPAAIGEGPEAASGHGPGLRERLAADYLRGEGLEIGPLHSPLGVPPGVGVRYVDRMPVTLLRRHYPELAGLPLVEIDVMDDGERLATVPDESQDFVVANHLLEHTGDPIGTLANWLRVLKPGGVIYLAVPDKRFTFDIEREPTAVEHMVEDFERGAENSRRQHFEEWARHVERVDDELVAERADILEQIDYSVHTHVFTGRTLIELLLAERPAGRTDRDRGGAPQRDRDPGGDPQTRSLGSASGTAARLRRPAHFRLTPFYDGGPMPAIEFVLAPRQNAFFSELVEILRAELAGLGVDVRVSIGEPTPGDAVPVLVPPHEYAALTEGDLDDETLARTIFVCAEPPGSPWFESNVRLAPSAGAMFDINKASVEAFAAAGVEATHLPLGYAPSWDRFDPAASRPVDLCFLGCATERREHVLAGLAPTLARTAASS